MMSDIHQRIFYLGSRVDSRGTS